MNGIMLLKSNMTVDSETFCMSVLLKTLLRYVLHVLYMFINQ